MHTLSSDLSPFCLFTEDRCHSNRFSADCRLQQWPKTPNSDLWPLTGSQIWTLRQLLSSSQATGLTDPSTVLYWGKHKGVNLGSVGQPETFTSRGEESKQDDMRQEEISRKVTRGEKRKGGKMRYQEEETRKERRRVQVSGEVTNEGKRRGKKTRSKELWGQEVKSKETGWWKKAKGQDSSRRRKGKWGKRKEGKWDKKGEETRE